jgi:hypothetical protein
MDLGRLSCRYHKKDYHVTVLLFPEMVGLAGLVTTCIAHHSSAGTNKPGNPRQGTKGIGWGFAISQA